MIEFPYFLFFFLVFDRDIAYMDFNHVAASNATIDDVTNWVTHRIFNANS